MESFIIFVIIALVSAFTNAAKKQQGQGKNAQRPNPQAPPNKPITRQPQHGEHPYKPPQAVKPVAAAKPAAANVYIPPKEKRTFTPKPQLAAPSIAAMPEGITMEGMSLEGLPLDYNIAAASTVMSSNTAEGKPYFSREQVLSGIIMSEILGKPKALRK